MGDTSGGRSQPVRHRGEHDGGHDHEDYSNHSDHSDLIEHHPRHHPRHQLLRANWRQPLRAAAAESRAAMGTSDGGLDPMQLPAPVPLEHQGARDGWSCSRQLLVNAASSSSLSAASTPPSTYSPHRSPLLAHSPHNLHNLRGLQSVHNCSRPFPSSFHPALVSGPSPWRRENHPPHIYTNQKRRGQREQSLQSIAVGRGGRLPSVLSPLSPLNDIQIERDSVCNIRINHRKGANGGLLLASAREDEETTGPTTHQQSQYHNGAAAGLFPLGRLTTRPLRSAMESGETARSEDGEGALLQPPQSCTQRQGHASSNVDREENKPKGEARSVGCQQAAGDGSGNTSRNASSTSTGSTATGGRDSSTGIGTVAFSAPAAASSSSAPPIGSWAAAGLNDAFMGRSSPLHPSTSDQSTFFGYCFDRGNGRYTRLVPADTLSPSSGIIPAAQNSHHGLIILPDPQSTASAGLPTTQLTNILAQAVGAGRHGSFSGTPRQGHFGPHNAAPGPLGPPHGVALPMVPRSSKKSKVFCDKWVHEGICAFTQQGCKFKHEMPHDRATQKSLGLFHGYPNWYKRWQLDQHQAAQQAQMQAPAAASGNGSLLPFLSAPSMLGDPLYTMTGGVGGTFGSPPFVAPSRPLTAQPAHSGAYESSGPSTAPYSHFVSNNGGSDGLGSDVCLGEERPAAGMGAHAASWRVRPTDAQHLADSLSRNLSLATTAGEPLQTSHHMEHYPPAQPRQRNDTHDRGSPGLQIRLATAFPFPVTATVTAPRCTTGPDPRATSQLGWLFDDASTQRSAAGTATGGGLFGPIGPPSPIRAPAEDAAMSTMGRSSGGSDAAP